jgi:transposase-like protein
MRCYRCGADATVEKHTVDGFEGYLCPECLAAWERLVG